MKRIKIKAGKVEVVAQLNDSATARRIWESLPISASVRTWGEEIYFPIPVAVVPQNLVDIVQKGDLAYWPDGRCLCIFFGPTPISSGDEIKPASSVEVIGKVLSQPEEFKAVSSGEKIILQKADGD